jgi:hypothetical protein
MSWSRAWARDSPDTQHTPEDRLAGCYSAVYRTPFSTHIPHTTSNCTSGDIHATTRPALGQLAPAPGDLTREVAQDRIGQGRGRAIDPVEKPREIGHYPFVGNFFA